MLYLIGLGLQDEKDISLRSLDILKKIDVIYLENYTSRLNFNIKNLEKLAGKKIDIASREMLENDMERFINNAANKDIALLVIGDPLLATTHLAIILEAKKYNIKTQVIHNASVLTAIADTGLSLYNFGKIASIPFDNKNVTSPVEIAKENKKLGMHTLFLLDIKEGKYMSVEEGLKYLLEKNIKDEFVVCCAGLGNEKQKLKAGKISKIINEEFNLQPACIILPGKMHFMEEEAIKQWLV